MLQIQTIPVTPLDQNCRILWEKGQTNAVVIDPGGDVEQITSFLAKTSLTCSAIWLTHSHFDHVGGVADLKSRTSAPLFGSKIEAEMRAAVSRIASMWGLEGFGFKDCPEPETYIAEGDVLSIADYKFEVYDTPGHSPGHVVFYCRSENLLICGDTVFSGSIGRTDIPGGNHSILMESINKKIMTLPDVTRLLSGHGPDTTVGVERKTNPYLSGIGA